MNAPLLAFALPYLLICAGTWLLTRITGARWLLALFESEDKPSARIVMGCLVIVVTLFLQAAGRISEGMVEANYFLSGSLFGLGTTKLIATRFAARVPVPDTQISAKNAPITTDTVNMQAPTDGPSNPQT